MNVNLTLKSAFAAAGLAILTACSAPPTPNQPLENNARRLTAGEREMAQEIFGNQIDYDRIFIKRKTAKGDRSSVVSGRMIMTPQRYESDYSNTNNIYNQVIFMHEMTHIWQEQRGTNMVKESIEEFFKHGFDKHGPYEYNRADLEHFEDLGLEQQAKIIQNYVHWILLLDEENKDRFCEEIELHRDALLPTFPHLDEAPDLCR